MEIIGKTLYLSLAPSGISLFWGKNLNFFDKYCLVLLGGQVLVSGHVDDENALLKNPEFLVKIRCCHGFIKTSKIAKRKNPVGPVDHGWFF